MNDTGSAPTRTHPPRSVAVAISPGFHRRILKAAKQLRISPSEAMRRALDAGLKALCRENNPRCNNCGPKIEERTH